MNKSTNILIRLDPVTKKILQHNAAIRDLSVSAYVRSIIKKELAAPELAPERNPKR